MIMRFFEPGRIGLKGGMGAVAPMKRSAADVEIVACEAAARGTFGWHDNTSPARHDQHATQLAPGGYVQDVGVAR